MAGLLGLLGTLSGLPGCSTPASPSASAAAPNVDARWPKPDDAALRTRLTRMQYDVTQNAATEPPFNNAFWDHHEAGLYVDVVTGEPLFASSDKFDSGTGWPSFTRPVEPERVGTEVDRKFGMLRVEVHSASGKSHLGHVFEDGPAEHGGLRYCINSASLRFVPLALMEAEGYGAYVGNVSGEAVAPEKAKFCPTEETADQLVGCATSYETAILAGGCFWGMEDLLREIPGVIETDVGYTGGTTPNPSYEDVKKGTTGHAEAVRVVYDPTKLAYADLLAKWFFRMHDPTTLNRQGNDRGSQYRSVIFATTEEQAKVAADVKAQVQASGFWKAPIVTEIVPAGAWTPAEEYHQDYLEKWPGGYTCHWMRNEPQ